MDRVSLAIRRRIVTAEIAGRFRLHEECLGATAIYNSAAPNRLVSQVEPELLAPYQ